MPDRRHRDGTGPGRRVVELPPTGYELGELIGKGGMGEVIAAHDLRIGRDVAIKRMRSPRPDSTQLARFLREARVQARLDHPAIVPVYELGTDDDGKPFFTMKRLAGTTLAQRLAEGAPLPLLLRAFIDVCLAVDFAHARGVVHRDLKPENIMLGDYGEVYVIDWGLARVLADAAQPRTRRHRDARRRDLGGGAARHARLHGARADAGPRGRRRATDVYALGSILFEILTAQPLHPRGEGALGSTLTTPQQSPSERVPARGPGRRPELDARVPRRARRATMLARPTARELADRVQRYLDGDRDLERRRALAAEQLVAARAAFESDQPDARETAVRHASRALALDPDSEEAAGVVNALVFETPPEIPPALQITLDEQERAFERTRLIRVQFAYIGLLSSWLAVPFLTVINWTALFVFTALVFLAMAHAYRTYTTGKHNFQTSLVINMLMILSFSRVLGPFMLTPTLIAGGVLTLSAVRQISERPAILITWVAATVMLPIVLEWAGVLPTTWWFADGKLETVSAIFALDGHTEATALVIINLAFQCIICWAALANSRARLGVGARPAQARVAPEADAAGRAAPGGRRGRPAKRTDDGRPTPRRTRPPIRSSPTIAATERRLRAAGDYELGDAARPRRHGRGRARARSEDRPRCRAQAHARSRAQRRGDRAVPARGADPGAPRSSRDRAGARGRPRRRRPRRTSR